MIYLWSHTSNIPCDGVSTLASNLTVYQPQCINTGDQVLDLLKVNKVSKLNSAEIFKYQINSISI